MQESFPQLNLTTGKKAIHSKTPHIEGTRNLQIYQTPDKVVTCQTHPSPLHLRTNSPPVDISLHNKHHAIPMSTSLGETMCKIKNSSLLLSQQISPWKIMEVLLYKPQPQPKLPLDPCHIWRVVEFCSCQGLSSCSSHSVYELLNSQLPHQPISGEVVNSVQHCKQSRFYSSVTAREFHLANLTLDYSIFVKFSGHYKHETVVIQF